MKNSIYNLTYSVSGHMKNAIVSERKFCSNTVLGFKLKKKQSQNKIVKPYECTLMWFVISLKNLFRLGMKAGQFV